MTRRIHVTIPTDSIPNATAEELDSFCALVVARVGAAYPGATVTAETANALRTTVAAPLDVDADDVAGMVGGPVWDAWCRGERAS